MDYKRLLRKAYKTASAFSHDQSTQIGALIVNPVTEEILASAANRFPTQALRKDARNHERPRKYAFTEHAERGVIYECAAQGIQTRGTIMVATAACCADCARAIALCGITLVVTHKQCMDCFNQAWQESIAQGCEILDSYGVAYWKWDGELNNEGSLNHDVSILLNGEEWTP